MSELSEAPAERPASSKNPSTVTLWCDRECGRGIIYLSQDQTAETKLKGGERVVGFRCLPCREAETAARNTVNLRKAREARRIKREASKASALSP